MDDHRQMYVKRTAHQEIADTLRKSLPLNLKALFTGPSITAELAPLLLRIISPDLKPVRHEHLVVDISDTL